MVDWKRYARPLYHWGPTRCPVCDYCARTRRQSVLWKDLGEEWALSAELYVKMDEREGRLCRMCYSNWRVRQLTRAFLTSLANRHDIHCRSAAVLSKHPQISRVRISEINEVAGLHPFIAGLPGLVHSEYGSQDPLVPSEDLLALTYQDNSFDYVIDSDTLEHVPDYDTATHEIRRILKPGGQHIFNIPVIWTRPTRVRAQLKHGELVHLSPPSYHAGPSPNQSDYLVFYEFGADIVERTEIAGFRVNVIRDKRNELVSTFIATRI